MKAVTTDRHAGMGRIGGCGAWLRTVVLLGGALLLPVRATAQAPDPFVLREPLTDYAIFSCQKLTLDSSATTRATAGSTTTPSRALKGHVRSNGTVEVRGGAVVSGDATAGPGSQVVVATGSQVKGARSGDAPALNCRPLDLATLKVALLTANDNAKIPLTRLGKRALGGADGRTLALGSGDALSLPPGTYLLSGINISGTAELKLSGNVRILCYGNVLVAGASKVNASGNSFGLHLWVSGSSVRLGPRFTMNGFVYAPKATVTAEAGKLTGGLFGNSVSLSAAAQVVRSLDVSPPKVRIVSPGDAQQVPSCSIPVTGTASDGQTLVSLTVNGVPVTPDAGGAFSTAVALRAADADTITAVARDQGQNTATAVVHVVPPRPAVTLESPLPGSLLGRRVVDLAGSVSPEATVAVNGVPAAVQGGSWALPGFDLGGEGPVTLAIVAASCTTPTFVQAAVTVDSAPPLVTVDQPAPANGCLEAGTPVSLAGRLVDTAYPGFPPPAVQVVVSPTGASPVTRPAVVDAASGVWALAGVDLGTAEGNASVTVVATDAAGNVGRASRSFVLDTAAPAVTLTLDGAPFPGQVPGPSPATGEQATLLGRAVAFRAVISDSTLAQPAAATLTLDGQPYAAGTPISTEGEHLLVATATDCAGRETVAHALFRLDLTPRNACDPQGGSC